MCARGGPWGVAPPAPGNLKRVDILSRIPSYRLSKDSPRPPPSFFTPLHYVRFPGNDAWPAEQERSCTASALARLTNPSSPRDRYPAFPYGWRPLRARCKRCWPRRETLWYPRKLSLSRDATPMGNVTVKPMPGGQCAPPAAKSSSLRATQYPVGPAAFLASRHERGLTPARYKGRLKIRGGQGAHYAEGGCPRCVGAARRSSGLARVRRALGDAARGRVRALDAAASCAPPSWRARARRRKQETAARGPPALRGVRRARSLSPCVRLAHDRRASACGGQFARRRRPCAPAWRRASARWAPPRSTPLVSALLRSG